MYRIPEIALGSWLVRDRRRPETESRAHFQPPHRARQFNLLRWISILGFIAILIVSMAFAAVVSHFVKREILENDATLTSQFIASLAESQGSQAGLGANVTLGQLLDQRTNIATLGIDRSSIGTRGQEPVLRSSAISARRSAGGCVCTGPHDYLVDQLGIGRDERAGQREAGRRFCLARQSELELLRAHVHEAAFVRQPEKQISKITFRYTTARRRGCGSEDLTRSREPAAYIDRATYWF